MARRPVTLDPKVQEQLLAQMREEQASRFRWKQFRNFVTIPGLIALTLVGTVMAFSEDATTAMVGNFFASSILMVVWKLRKRISSAFGD